MRQHPIPQNVLDVEFKLFTRFTIKEFAYLAAGVGGGGLFLFLSGKDIIPGIIAFPIAFVLASFGAFLALVPINEQGADEFIKNYFVAINKPTQRVWLNSQMKEDRNKPILEKDAKEKAKIVGGSSNTTTQAEIFAEKPGDDILEFKQVQTRPQTNPTSTTQVQNQIVLGPQNISQYQFQIQSVDKLPGNINIWISDTNNRPVISLPVYIKDQNGKVIYANRTGPNGYFLVNQMIPEGVYNIEFEKGTYKIPNIQWILTKNQSKYPVKIIANN